MRNTILYLLPLICIVSCSKIQDETSLEELNILETKSSGGRIDQESNRSYYVSSADIDNYVNFKILEAKGGNRTLSLEEIISLRASQEQEPLMYVINYNEGWEVVSGDKRTPVVLASGPHGTLDLDALGNGGLEDGIMLWLDGEAAGINALREMSKAEDDAFAMQVQSNLDFWNLISSKEENGGDRFGPGIPAGHYEVVGVTTQTVVLESTQLDVPGWKVAEPYTSHDYYTQQCLRSPIIAAGKTTKALYDIWEVPQTAPTDPTYSTVTWSSLSSGYNTATGDFLSDLCRYMYNGGGSFEPESIGNNSPRTTANQEISDAQSLLSLYQIPSTVSDYDVTTVNQMLWDNGYPVVVAACNSRILWGLIYYDSWTFVIDKFRRLDHITTVTEEWVYDDPEPGSPGGIVPSVDPRITVTHTYSKEIGMSWGFAYNAQYQTDGDDLWFSYTNWSIFDNTYPYQRKMLKSINEAQ